MVFCFFTSWLKARVGEWRVITMRCVDFISKSTFKLAQKSEIQKTKPSSVKRRSWVSNFPTKERGRGSIFPCTSGYSFFWERGRTSFLKRLKEKLFNYEKKSSFNCQKSMSHRPECICSVESELKPSQLELFGNKNQIFELERKPELVSQEKNSKINKKLLKLLKKFCCEPQNKKVAADAACRFPTIPYVHDSLAPTLSNPPKKGCCERANKNFISTHNESQ